MDGTSMMSPADANQTQTILGNLGRFVAYAGSGSAAGASVTGG